MLGSPILDVALGLIFIYLIYSLFVTTIMELLATIFGLRARLLRSTLYRMLNDDQAVKPWTFMRLIDDLTSFICFFIPPRWRWIHSKPSLAWTFYNMPAIKYLGLSVWFKRPSYISSERFAKTVCDILRSPADGFSSSSEERIAQSLATGKVNPSGLACQVEPETLHFLNSLWIEKPGEGQSREDKFKQQLIQWFNETMELLSGRYKRRMQMNTFVLGFLIALVFNVNSIEISTRLATNDKAREALVSLASAWIEQHGSDTLPSPAEPDTALALKPMVAKTIQMLQNDLAEPNNLLALGYRVPDDFHLLKSGRVDSVVKPSKSSLATGAGQSVSPSSTDFYARLKALEMVYHKRCRKAAAAIDTHKPLTISTLVVSPCKSLPYSARLTAFDRFLFVMYYVLSNYAIGGFLITAIAISLGAPFWFELLNKIVKMRSEGKKTL